MKLAADTVDVRERKRAGMSAIGEQDEKIHDCRVWVLPNPSGLNAHYQAKDLGAVFGELRAAVDRRVASR